MTPPRPRRRHDRPHPTAAGAGAGSTRALALLAVAALTVTLSGCVCEGPFASRRLFAERHSSGEKQVVLTTSGQFPPPACEVHHARMNHGAPRVYHPPPPILPPSTELCPWLPGFLAWTLTPPGAAVVTECADDAAPCDSPVLPIPPPFAVSGEWPSGEPALDERALIEWTPDASTQDK